MPVDTSTITSASPSYEGEFQAGFVHGIGQYVSPTTGEMYRGEWNAGKRQGCGVLTDMNPFYKRVAAGMDPQEAWEASKDEIEANEKWGTWHGDYYVSEVDDTGKNCGYYEIKCVLQTRLLHTSACIHVLVYPVLHTLRVRTSTPFSGVSCRSWTAW